MPLIRASGFPTGERLSFCSTNLPSHRAPPLGSGVTVLRGQDRAGEEALFPFTIQ